MRRRHTDIVRGLENRTPNTGTAPDVDVTQPNFKQHVGATTDEDIESATEKDEAKDKRRTKATSRAVDAFEAGIAAWIVRNFKTLLTVAAVGISGLVVAVFYGTFHVTRFQTGLENTQQDLKEIRSDIRRLSEDAIQRNARMNQLEKNQERLERNIGPTQRSVR